MNTKRHELTDIQWKILEPYLPKDSPNGGRPWKDHRQVLNGIFWKLNTGAPWRDIPERYGPWQTVYDRYRYWRKSGLWDELMRSIVPAVTTSGSLGLSRSLHQATTVGFGNSSRSVIVTRSDSNSLNAPPQPGQAMIAHNDRSVPANPVVYY